MLTFAVHGGIVVPLKMLLLVFSPLFLHYGLSIRKYVPTYNRCPPVIWHKYITLMSGPYPNSLGHLMPLILPLEAPLHTCAAGHFSCCAFFGTLSSPDFPRCIVFIFLQSRFQLTWTAVVVVVVVVMKTWIENDMKRWRSTWLPILTRFINDSSLSCGVPVFLEISAEKMHSAHQRILRAFPTETAVAMDEHIIHTVWLKTLSRIWVDVISVKRVELGKSI